MNKPHTITGGIYLVLNPATEIAALLEKLAQALEAGIQVLQIWNNWPPSFRVSDKEKLITTIANMASAYAVPLLINEEWELLKNTQLSGVHFDQIPENYAQIQSEIKRKFIAGITCSNDLSVIDWAEKNKLDYISFCAVFPSASVNTCEIVRLETIRKAKALTQIPIFLSGGITPENMLTLKEFDMAGVAVISGILQADSPKKATVAYQQSLKKLTL